MALSEKTVVDQITVGPQDTVFVRETTIIEKDGGEIAKTYHRYSLVKGQDISEQPDKVKAVCTAAWS